MTNLSALLRTRLGDVCAGLILLALTSACFARLVTQPGALIVDAERPSVDHAQRDDSRPPGNDLTFLYLPHYTHVADEIRRSGKLPQWDARGFGGRPMVGNPQGGLFYPPVWLAWWSRSPATLGWLTVGHLLWAALGMYGLVRDLGAGRPAATVSAGCFLMSPYVLAQVFEGHYPHVWAASWYPWAIRGYRLLRAGRVSAAFVMAPVLALSFLTGHPQEWYYLSVAISLWVVVDAALAARRQDYRHALILLGGWTIAVGLTLGLAAVELLPDLSAQQWTLRGSRLSLARVTRYHVHLLNLFQLLDPGALGGPANYFGHDNYWESVLSLGMVPLLLAGVAVARHPDPKLARGWLVLVLGAAAFAAGRKLGVFTVLFDLLPGMNRFRVPSRSLFLAALGGSVLAGLGVDTLSRRSFVPEDWQRLWRWFRNGTIVVLALLILMLPLGINGETRPVARPERPMSLREIRTLLRGDRAGTYPWALAATNVLASGRFWSALAGMTLVLAAARRRTGRHALCAVALGMVGLAELAADGHALIRVAPAGRFLGRDPISDVLAGEKPAASGPSRIRVRDTLYSDLRASTHGFEKININDSFQIQHAADLYETLYPLLYVIAPPDPTVPLSEVVHETRRQLRQGVLDRWSVAILVSDHVEPEPAWPLVATGSLEGRPFAVHRNPGAMPRAYVVPRAEPTVDEVAPVLAAVRTVNPRRAVLMPRDPLGTGGPRQPFTPAAWSSPHPDRLVIAANVEAPGLLVVADTWMPGWSATVDGRAAPILRGNHAQRVVPLRTTGSHEVVLTYEAPGLARGLVIAAVSACVCVCGAGALILRCLRQAVRRSSHQEPGVQGPSPRKREWSRSGDRMRQPL